MDSENTNTFPFLVQNIIYLRLIGAQRINAEQNNKRKFQKRVPSRDSPL